MQVVTGAMGSLIPKLFQLLQEEYKLQKGVKQDVEFLVRELPSMHAALRKVADVPRDKLDKQVKIWADEVRDLSYIMEDVVDSFLVSADGSDPAANSHMLKELLGKMGNMIPKGKARRKIANKIKGIKILVKEVADRRDRYRVDDAVANIAATPDVDPRLLALFKNKKELVGTDVARDEITKKLTVEDVDGDVPNKQLKILSIFGFGGLGKTTIAKVVHDGLRENFVLKAFISVGQKPDVKKVLKDILLELDKGSHMVSNALDEKQLIEELQKILENKRYFIVIDDIWDVEAWKIIRCALKDSNCGSRVITTTRILDVAKNSGEVYQLKPLSQDNSEELFYTRLYGGKSKGPFDQSVEISKKILQKCGGIPLAIITIASLLEGKPREDWSKVYDSIGFGHGENKDVDNTRKILLFSYYDLPYYLRACLLYVSIYPDDYTIRKKTLILKWLAEGFIKEEPGIGQYELGERYFNELVNRSMIPPIEHWKLGDIVDCRVHDLVLDMICLLSEDEKFVTIMDTNEKNISCQSNWRRLAIQKRSIEKGDFLANICTPQVRSINVTTCGICEMPSHSNFGALRVLDMEGCNFVEDRSYHLDFLGSLVQLRYLGLFNMPISEIPEDIGKLKYLQTIDWRNTKIKELPKSFVLLSQLKHFYVSRSSNSIIGRLHLLCNLTLLEDIMVVYTGSSPEFVTQLGKLTELRTLYLSIWCAWAPHPVDAIWKALVNSLGKLQNLQAMTIFCDEDIGYNDLESYVPSQKLQQLTLLVHLVNIPSWISPSLLPNLKLLELTVDEVQTRHMEILGSLPELVSLELWGRQKFPHEVMASDGGGSFPKWRFFQTRSPMRFLPGAMPTLEKVRFSPLEVGWLKSKNDKYVFEAGCLNNLPSLQRVQANIFRMNAAQEDLDAAKVSLELATSTHPNRPSHEIAFW